MKLAKMLKEIKIEGTEVEIVYKRIDSPVWKSELFQKMLSKLWSRKSVTEYTKPQNIVKLILCCRGYDFNHLNVRVGGAETVRYAWERIDTLCSKLSYHDKKLGRELRQLRDGRGCMQYSYRFSVDQPFTWGDGGSLTPRRCSTGDIGRFEIADEISDKVCRPTLLSDSPRVFESLGSYILWERLNSIP